MKLNDDTPENWNPTEKLTTPELLEDAQKRVNDARKRYYDDLSEENRKKLDIIESTVRMLEENGIKFALFAEDGKTFFQFHKVSYSEDAVTSHYDEYAGKIIPLANSLVSPYVMAVHYVDKDGKPIMANFRTETGYMKMYLPKISGEQNINTEENTNVNTQR